MKYEREIGEWTTDFAVDLIKFSAELKKTEIDKDVITQLRRCGTSVGANVNEGKGSSSKKELIRFYEIAFRSSKEFSFWSSVIERGYDYNSDRFAKCKNEMEEIKKVLASIIIKLKGQKPL